MASHRHHRTESEDDDDIFGHLHHRHQHQTQHKSKLPVIPDLRFEYSYLRSIRPYVHVETLGNDDSVSSRQRRHSSVEELLEDYEKLELRDNAVVTEKQSTSVAQSPSPGPKELVHVQWKKVLWVTTRDQVISPLLQGALWAIASYFLTPYSANLGSKLGHLMHAKPPTKEGNGAGWLRKWVKSLGLTAKSTEEAKR